MKDLVGLQHNSFKNEYLQLSSLPTEQTICHEESLRIDLKSSAKKTIVANLKKQTKMTTSEMELVETERELSKLRRELTEISEQELELMKSRLN